MEQSNSNNEVARLQAVAALDPVSSKNRLDVQKVVEHCQKEVKVPKWLIIKWLNIQKQKSLFKNWTEESQSELSRADDSQILEELSKTEETKEPEVEEYNCMNKNNVPSSYFSTEKEIYSYQNHNEVENLNSALSRNVESNHRFKVDWLRSSVKALDLNPLQSKLKKTLDDSDETRTIKMSPKVCSTHRKLLKPIEKSINIRRDDVKDAFMKTFTPRHRSLKAIQKLVLPIEAPMLIKNDQPFGSAKDWSSSVEHSEPNGRRLGACSPQETCEQRPTSRRNGRNKCQEVNRLQLESQFLSRNEFGDRILQKPKNGLLTTRSQPLASFLSRVQEATHATSILPPLKWEARDGRMNLDKFKMDSWFKSHNTPGNFTFRYGKDAEIAAKLKRSSNCKAVREVSFDEFEENPFKAPAAYIDMRKSFKDSLNDSKIRSTSLSRCSSSSQFKVPNSKRRHLGFYPTNDI